MMGASQKFWALNYKSQEVLDTLTGVPTFGKSIATNVGLDRFAVGASSDSIYAVKVLSYDGVGIAQQASIGDPTPAVDGYWGEDVLIDSTGTKILISKPKIRTLAPYGLEYASTVYESPVYLYELISGSWVNTKTIPGPSGATSGFGLSMVANADFSKVVVSDPRYNISEGRLTYYSYNGSSYVVKQSFQFHAPAIDKFYGAVLDGTTNLEFISSISHALTANVQAAVLKYNSGTDSFVETYYKDLGNFYTQCLSDDLLFILNTYGGAITWIELSPSGTYVGSGNVFVAEMVQITKAWFSHDGSQLSVSYKTGSNLAEVRIYDRVGTVFTLNQIITDPYPFTTIEDRNFGFDVGFVDTPDSIIVGKYSLASPGRVTAFNL